MSNYLAHGDRDGWCDKCVEHGRITAGLDVAKLAEALEAEWLARYMDPPDWTDATDVWAERANGIAAEYARLAGEEEG